MKRNLVLINCKQETHAKISSFKSQLG